MKAKVGRPDKYAEPTVTLAFRVPESRKEHIRLLVKQLLKEWEV